MNDLNQRRAYNEVLTILKSLKLEKKIPEEILKNMEEEQDKEWNFSFDFEKPLESQRMLKSTATLLSVLYITYICEDENEKRELKEIYEANEKKFST